MMKPDLLRELRKRWLSPLTALHAVGCLSLSQRCGEFRREGWPVHDRWLKLANGKRVKEYRIIGRRKA